MLLCVILAPTQKTEGARVQWLKQTGRDTWPEVPCGSTLWVVPRWCWVCLEAHLEDSVEPGEGWLLSEALFPGELWVRQCYDHFNIHQHPLTFPFSSLSPTCIVFQFLLLLSSSIPCLFSPSLGFHLGPPLFCPPSFLLLSILCSSLHHPSPAPTQPLTEWLRINSSNYDWPNMAMHIELSA